MLIQIKLLQKLKNYFSIEYIINFFKYGFSAGVGFLIDAILSAFFHYILEFHVFYSNLIAGFIALSLLYFVSNYYIFKTRHSYFKMTLFFSYYVVSITFFSYVITVLYNLTHWNFILIKVMIIPISYVTNYFFASKILQIKKE